MSDDSIPLCSSADLAEGGRAVSFDVVYGGETCRAFAVRFGQPAPPLLRLAVLEGGRVRANKPWTLAEA